MKDDLTFNTRDIFGFYALRGGGLKGLSLAIEARQAATVRQGRWADARTGKDQSRDRLLKKSASGSEHQLAVIGRDIASAGRVVPAARVGTMGISGRLTRGGVGVSGYSAGAYGPDGKLVGKSCTGKTGQFVMELSHGASFLLAVYDAADRECHADHTARPYVDGDVAFITIDLADGGACKEPPGERSDSGLAAVPNLIGMPDEQAQKVIAKAGLALGDRSLVEDDKNAGLVVRQSPKAGTGVQPQSAIDLVIGAAGAGEEGIKVPDLRNHDLATAAGILKAARLGLGQVRVGKSANAAAILNQKPAAGEMATAQSKVHVEVGLTGDFGGDASVLGSLFDLQAGNDAGIDGASLLKRLRDQGIESYVGLEEALAVPSGNFGAKIGIIEEGRVGAIQAAMQKVVKLARSVI